MEIASALLGLLLAHTATAEPVTKHIEVTVAVRADGSAVEPWLDMLQRRLPARAVAKARATRRTLSGEDRAWVELIRSRTEAWMAMLSDVVAPFEPVEPPSIVHVVLGNRGGEDAFTHDPTTVGFDLSRLESLYGDAASPGNRDRIDRLFLHEYTHLLQKAWLPSHPQPGSTPFERAELEVWLEGLGNYRSMSDRWRAHSGELPAVSRAALERLESRFLARMVALACATPEEEATLTADLSSGPFGQKWGALTAALWLEQAASADPGALRRFVQSGVAGVRELARAHFSPPAFAQLETARQASRECRASGPL